MTMFLIMFLTVLTKVNMQALLEADVWWLFLTQQTAVCLNLNSLVLSNTKNLFKIFSNKFQRTGEKLHKNSLMLFEEIEKRHSAKDLIEEKPGMCFENFGSEINLKRLRIVCSNLYPS